MTQRLSPPAPICSGSHSRGLASALPPIHTGSEGGGASKAPPRQPCRCPASARAFTNHSLTRAIVSRPCNGTPCLATSQQLPPLSCWPSPESQLLGAQRRLSYSYMYAQMIMIVDLFLLPASVPSPRFAPRSPPLPYHGHQSETRSISLISYPRHSGAKLSLRGRHRQPTRDSCGCPQANSLRFHRRW